MICLLAISIFPHVILAEESVTDLSFYKPVPDGWVVGQVSGQEIENIILCIGDGMGFNQVALARNKVFNLQGRLWMETLPVTGSVQTFSANRAVTDSAAAATAMACGVKTNNGVLGIDADGNDIFNDSGNSVGKRLADGISCDFDNHSCHAGCICVTRFVPQQ